MSKTNHPETKHKMALDIHNYDKRISSCLKRIEHDLSKKNVELIKKYHKFMKLETIAKATHLKHLEILLNLSRFLKKDWALATLDDVQNLVIHFMELYSSNGQETNTTADHKKVLKIFFRFLQPISCRPVMLIGTFHFTKLLHRLVSYHLYPFVCVSFPFGSGTLNSLRDIFK